VQFYKVWKTNICMHKLVKQAFDHARVWGVMRPNARKKPANETEAMRIVEPLCTSARESLMRRRDRFAAKHDLASVPEHMELLANVKTALTMREQHAKKKAKISEEMIRIPVLMGPESSARSWSKRKIQSFVDELTPEGRELVVKLYTRHLAHIEGMHAMPDYIEELAQAANIANARARNKLEARIRTIK
jgi:glutaredoxin-related protein